MNPVRFIMEFLPILVVLGGGVALLVATARADNEERAKRERVWTLEISPRGVCRLLGWVLTIGAVWRTVGYLADRRPLEFMVGAGVLLAVAKGVGLLKRWIAPEGAGR